MSIFQGTGVAIITPFTATGAVDYEALGNHVERLITNQVDYLVILGTTGEAVTLNAQEKNDVIQFILEKTDGRVPAVIGMGGNHTKEVVDKIKRTDFQGIAGILSVAPYYNKPSQEGLYQHFAKIAEASPVPVILYNVPGRTGVNITAQTTLRLAHNFENIVAIKEASGDMDQAMELISNKTDSFDVISGEDALTLPFLALGFAGVISVMANATPAHFSQMVKHARSGDIAKARQLHYRLLPLMNMLFAEGNPAGVKAALNSQRLIANQLRLPLVPVSEQLFKKITHEMESLN
ncbi:MAG: 4-hydroxy-tetrahydrodipicolinate synthase [Bacteroidales bacterium]|jgi:4-hydroxy-tetrahydrodipicolinate synthase